MSFDKEQAQKERYDHGPGPNVRCNVDGIERVVVDTVVREDTGDFLTAFKVPDWGDVFAVTPADWDKLLIFPPVQADFPPIVLARGTIWRHFKGGTYLVIAVATGVPDGEPLVIYRSHQTGNAWARTLEDWTAIVDRDGYRGQRFSLAV